MALITIIMPVMNGAEFVARTLECLREAGPKFKILIADGGSQDGTLDIIGSFIKSGLNAKIVSRSDLGQSNALNILLSNIETPFFFFWMNSDDLINPQFLFEAEKLISETPQSKKNLIASITANNFIIDQDDVIINRQPGMRDKAWLIKQGVWFGKFPSRIWNTNLVRQVGGFDEALFYSMDFGTLFKIIIKNDNLKFHHFEQFFGAFRFHSGSKTGQRANQSKIHAEMRNFLRFNLFYWVVTRALCHYFCAPPISNIYFSDFLNLA